MKAAQIRQQFLDFFESKKHTIVPSAPMVVKDDPTLMFTNAGMNQFKDIFLDLAPIKHTRVADSQKCLRVSGKHNDLEEVGVDTYHHTMFEMLGNWSFGDYFKKEAIAWAWELLVDVYGLPEERLYATIFEGNQEVPRDTEAFDFWKQYLPEDRIINGNAKDNFWEMGETGPCGPCSEIHIDLRDDDEREKVNGRDLVNQDHPLVIEIWNLVFIQFNRKSGGVLEKLPKTHVDTGMGFERLCMALQGKKSNYDTDVFQPIIQRIAQLSNKEYGKDEQTDIAIRVVADHIRTVAFSIAEGQLPSNNKAGYVIRRILRRAIRYAYTFLGMKEPFIYELVSVLDETLGGHFEEIGKQKTLIEQVVKEEENAFLRTLSNGLKLMDDVIQKAKNKDSKIIEGDVAFKLYDTYGFPLDLIDLIAREQGFTVDNEGFNVALEKQRAGSRTAISETDEWTFVRENQAQEFIGYDYSESKIELVKYRTVTDKKKKLYHLVFNHTPFYGESGGQIGDTGIIEDVFGNEYHVINTIKEHNEIIHVLPKLPEHLDATFSAKIALERRNNIKKNHSATHLLHYALRKVLGDHVQQKGSLVADTHLSFDFSHFQKMTENEIAEVEGIVNKLIQQNTILQEERALPIDEAKKRGAMALFGEKYGDVVRMIQFGDSVELCGGTHVSSTGEIGLLKITSESSIASGIRRIEAVTGNGALKYFNEHLTIVKELEQTFKVPTQKVLSSIHHLQEENKKLQLKIKEYQKQALTSLKKELKGDVTEKDGISWLIKKLEVESADQIRDLAYQLKGEINNLIFIAGANIKGKANLTIMFSQNLVEKHGLHAGNLVREVAKEIQGGGGGQPFFASAGGRNPEGIENAFAKAKEMIKAKL
ncbi:alanyl-tRNA synthetase [Balneicella halophila]|uniref:Alanine--tRNA ligase n=2 Tax=Balneicella halophila TaxID=1537566 RepID=A0A7L4UPI6_BALHA|nr:alanine--tRNA ligase [Balneicella halophila]PVX50954.1 alanyl-tRNA synthetase [Balneicella halophila]